MQKISRAKAQRRKERQFRNAVALCAFAPLREKYLPGVGLNADT